MSGKTVCLFIQKKFITMYLPVNKLDKFTVYVSSKRKIRKILQTYQKIFLHGSVISPKVCYCSFKIVICSSQEI
jgi:hypothetical protein